MIQKTKIEVHPKLLQLKQLFKIPILKIKPKNNWKNTYYDAITAFGIMCLIIQQYKQSDMNSNNLKQWLTYRNEIISSRYKCFPLVYEHHVVEKSEEDGGLLSLILMQDCVPLNVWLFQGSGSVKPTYFAKLIRNLQFIEQNNFILKQQLILQNLLFLKNSEQLITDFTSLSPKKKSQQQGQIKQKENHTSLYFASLKTCIKQLLQKKYNKKSLQINQIIFIKGKIFVFQSEKLLQANSYQQLLLFLNLYPNIEVQLIAKSASKPNSLNNNNINHEQSSPQKHPNKQNNQHSVQTYLNQRIKLIHLKQLEGNPKFSIQSKIFQNLQFIDGKCINCLREVFYQQLKEKFIKDGALYKLQQFQHLIVNVFENQIQQEKKKQQIVTVYPPVCKSDLISFLIAYIKCVQPSIKAIQYLQHQNSLRLTYQNRHKQQKYLNIVFYQQYTVKDEQISMILEKSNISLCKLHLHKMKISDSFLIFLSHFQKTSNIQELYLTDNHGLSDVGLSTYLRSPYSSKLKTLSLTIINIQNLLLEQSIELISNKKSLQKLYIKKSNINQSIMADQIDVSALTLSQLQLTGIKVTLNSVIKGNLKILRLDQIVAVEQLRHIKHLRLVELKIRLNQYQKKSLIESISSLTSLTSSLTLSITKQLNTKSQAVRIFAEGESKSTLKKLDISYSNCKYKTIHSLLLMNQLEHIILEGCINLGTQYEPISPKILTASFQNVQLNLEQLLTIIINRSKQFVELNIINTNIKKYDLMKLITSKKIYISNLIISEEQYSNKLLDSTNGYENIQCIELYIQRLLQPEQQYSLNSLISKGIKSQKTIRFILQINSNEKTNNQQEIDKKKQTLIDRMNKFIIMSNLKVDLLQNFYINKMQISELMQLQQNFQVNDYCQSLVASSVTITSNGCKISSSPKLVTRKQSSIPVLFKALQKQTIDKITHRFVKFMQENGLPVTVDISSNKLIGKQIFHIFKYYGKNLIRQINFKDCMFGMDEIIDTLFQINGIEIVNGGQYQINLNKTNFSKRSQSYIKFFMRLKYVEKLKVICEDIQQVQILFSVLAHILDHNVENIKYLSINFQQIVLNKQCFQFLKSLFTLQKLIGFQFVLKQVQIMDQRCSQIWHKSLNQLRSLKKLYLSIPSYNFPMINLPNLEQISLQYSDSQADQLTVNRTIKNLQNSKNIKILKLSLSNCINISNLNRIFGILPIGFLFQKLTSLQTLALNFQFCPLKQQTLFNMLNQIIKYQSLKILELNVSFAISNFVEFIKCIESIVEGIVRPIGIKIICVTSDSRNFLMQTESLAQKGVQFII